ncbi:DNA repair exonuclease SbcCD nuclease subunit [Paenibacillus phyllosphaerae]|uniref:DNA repair exonuclease SbcCD nuclease subunit n=1 Tax=Paenibacillus phyllosphaerae TaxID=274593 RepID=A0A7W5AWB8_9BACL|nr:DNA repair exonuclease SbcCD nuclease subunit [Paenibacillus phyllosphaerae]
MGIRFRFIHAADLHIDSPFRGLSEAPDYVREALADATIESAKKLTEAAIAHQVDFVVIAGDLYDGADRSLRAQLTLQREWERLHAYGVQLFVIHGNHDHLSGSRANLAWPPNVHIYGADEVTVKPAYTRTGELAAYVHGISYANRAVSENLAKRYQALGNETYQIGLLHANVDGDASHDPYSPCSLTELVGSGFHYWALGHIHNRHIMHQDPYVVYSGNTQGRHAKETGAKGCYLVDVTPQQQTQLAFIPLDTVRFETVSVDLTGQKSEQGLLDAMEAAIGAAVMEHAGCRLMIRVRLVGRSGLHAKLMEATFGKELLEGLREQLAYDSDRGTAGDWVWVTSLEVRTGAELQLETLAEEDSFAGEVYRMLLDLSQHHELRQQVLDEATAPLMSNARLRRLVRGYSEEQLAQLLNTAGEMACGMLADDQRQTDREQSSKEEQRS